MCPDRIYRGVIYKEGNEVFLFIFLVVGYHVYPRLQLSISTFYAVQTWHVLFLQKTKDQIVPKKKKSPGAESVKTKHWACRIMSSKTCCLRPACLDVGQFSTVAHSHGAQRCHGQVGRRKSDTFSIVCESSLSRRSSEAMRSSTPHLFIGSDPATFG